MSDDFLYDDDDNFVESKSARKRQMHALQNLGEQLVELSASQLQKLNLDNEALIEAVQLAQRISHHSGKRRQMQFIGKLMRSADAEHIADALDALHETSRKAKAGPMNTRERERQGIAHFRPIKAPGIVGKILSLI